MYHKTIPPSGTHHTPPSHVKHELTILVPVYNEEPTLPVIMGALHASCPHAQVIYIDDGSTDRSLEILRSHAGAHDLVIQGNHGGKGSAIRLGLEKAEGAYTVIQDADLEYDPKEIDMLLQEAKKRSGSVVFGSRFFNGKTPHLYWRFLMGNKCMTWCLNILFRTRLTDCYTCYKLLPTHIFQHLQLQSSGFEMEAEIASKCLKQGIPIIEVPISYRPRSIEQGKKINWKDAIKGLRMMLSVWSRPYITREHVSCSRPSNPERK